MPLTHGTALHIWYVKVPFCASNTPQISTKCHINKMVNKFPVGSTQCNTVCIAGCVLKAPISFI